VGAGLFNLRSLYICIDSLKFSVTEVRGKVQNEGMAGTGGLVVFCKSLRCNNPVAKKGRICDSCYLKLPGGRKPCPKCKSIIHIKQRECARHMLEAKGGVTRRFREPIPSAVKKAVYERDSYTCAFCGIIGNGLTHSERVKSLAIDHLVPVAAGGKSVIENLRVLCRKCNREKWLY